jgi:hypothetical protein
VVQHPDEEPIEKGALQQIVDSIHPRR